MKEHDTLYLADHCSTPLLAGLETTGMDIETSKMRFEEEMMYHLSVHLGVQVCYEHFEQHQKSDAETFQAQNTQSMLDLLDRINPQVIHQAKQQVIQEGSFWVKARVRNPRVVSMRCPILPEELLP